MSIDDVKRANANAGRFFFAPDTMRFFASRVCGSTLVEGPGGVFFVTSERPPHGQRRYTVRRFDPTTGMVDTAQGEKFMSYASRSGAADRAKKLAECNN